MIKRVSDISAEDCNEIMRQLIDGKNDREAAILAGAFLESMLFDLLRTTVVDSEFQRAATLFEHPRPLSSFGNMLQLAYAFGRISRDEFLFVRIVKRTRDLAAHSLTIRDLPQFAFNSEQVREILRDLSDPLSAAPEINEDQESSPPTTSDNAGQQPSA